MARQVDKIIILRTFWSGKSCHKFPYPYKVRITHQCFSWFMLTIVINQQFIDY